MIALALAAMLAQAPLTAAPAADAFAVVSEFDRIAERPLWPGFDPRTIPLAIFDGSRTLLVRHPHPPPGFTPFDAARAIHSYPGRHPDVASNTSVSLGGVPTATGLLSREKSPRQLAAVMIHEAFHVYQKKRHPTWTADEGELFVYPVEDVENLAAARLEIETLRRALLASKAEETRCLARAVATLRRDRLARLDPPAVAYERGTELKEGLAAYLEAAAAGIPDVRLAPGPFPAEEVRARAYASGPLIGRVLDRISPGWKEKLERGDADSLESLLQPATANAGGRVCDPSASERAAAEIAAREDVSRLDAERRTAREAFLAAPGWTVVVESQGEALWPNGFDPLNVRLVGPGELLHGRWVKLSNKAGQIEVFDRPSLTLAVGPHPLFQGVRRLTVTGLPEKPSVSESDGTMRLSAPGISLQFKGARIDTSGTTVRFVLGKQAV